MLSDDLERIEHHRGVYRLTSVALPSNGLMPLPVCDSRDRGDRALTGLPFVTAPNNSQHKRARRTGTLSSRCAHLPSRSTRSQTTSAAVVRATRGFAELLIPKTSRLIHHAGKVNPTQAEALT